MSEEPLYPMSLYVYDQKGYYRESIQIGSKRHLYSDKIKLIVRVAMAQKREIRITDPMDRLLFHAADGKILFDGKTIPEEEKHVVDDR